MSEDRESLAEQAAAWVPPWARRTPDLRDPAGADADATPDATAAPAAVPDAEVEAAPDAEATPGALDAAAVPDAEAVPNADAAPAESLDAETTPDAEGVTDAEVEAAPEAEATPGGSLDAEGGPDADAVTVVEAEGVPDADGVTDAKAEATPGESPVAYAGPDADADAESDDVEGPLDADAWPSDAELDAAGEDDLAEIVAHDAVLDETQDVPPPGDMSVPAPESDLSPTDAVGERDIPPVLNGADPDPTSTVTAAGLNGVAAAPEPLALIDDDEMRGALEAILLVVDEPVQEIVLAQIMEQPTDRVAETLHALAASYEQHGHGFELRRVGGGWRLYTRPRFAAYVERFVLDGQSVRLTQAALETLAVVAYKQPVTRSRISAIRGVNCDGVIRTLTSRGLVEECGTEPESGAFLYRTTTLFLEKLGLDSVEQLPPLAPFLPDDIDEVADVGR